MKELNVDNTNVTILTEDEEQTISHEIGNALRNIGIDPDSIDGQIEMTLWKSRRERNPGLYRKFVGGD